MIAALVKIGFSLESKTEEIVMLPEYITTETILLFFSRLSYFLLFD